MSLCLSAYVDLVAMVISSLLLPLLVGTAPFVNEMSELRCDPGLAESRACLLLGDDFFFFLWRSAG